MERRRLGRAFENGAKVLDRLFEPMLAQRDLAQPLSRQRRKDIQHALKLLSRLAQSIEFQIHLGETHSCRAILWLHATGLLESFRSALESTRLLIQITEEMRPGHIASRQTRCVQITRLRRLEELVCVEHPAQ